MKYVANLKRTAAERKWADRLVAAGLVLTDGMIRQARAFNRLPIDVLDESDDFARFDRDLSADERAQHPAGSGSPTTT